MSPAPMSLRAGPAPRGGGHRRRVGGRRPGQRVTAPDAAGGAEISPGISKRKRRPTRLGKPAGTGPTSAAGKARSAQNARKHGLNVAVMYDPGVSPDVPFLAGANLPG